MIPSIWKTSLPVLNSLKRIALSIIQLMNNNEMKLVLISKLLNLDTIDISSLVYLNFSKKKSNMKSQ